MGGWMDGWMDGEGEAVLNIPPLLPVRFFI